MYSPGESHHQEQGPSAKAAPPSERLSKRLIFAIQASSGQRMYVTGGNVFAASKSDAQGAIRHATAY